MSRAEELTKEIMNTVNTLNLHARVGRVSANCCKILSDNAEAVADIINRDFYDVATAMAMSKDMTMCMF